MTVILNIVRKGTYLDSVALMRMSRTVAAHGGGRRVRDDDGDARQQADHGGRGRARPRKAKRPGPAIS